MKNILLTFSLLLCISFPSIAQTIEDDFEGNGDIASWHGDDCNFDDSYPNPFINTDNASATVFRYQDVGGQYANVRFDYPTNLDIATNAVFSIKIYMPSSGAPGNQTKQVSLKLQDNTLNEPWTTQAEIIRTIVLDQWQTVVFDFENGAFMNFNAGSPPPVQRTDFNRVLIQLNGEDNNDNVEAFIDDFIYNVDFQNPNIDTDYDFLVWSDEFDGTGDLDESKWYRQHIIPNGSSWFNGEVQHYTDRIDNSYVEDGHLHILAKKETYTNQGQTKQYTSARLNSKFAFTYGKVEVRAKLPSGSGTWPAIWTLGKNVNENGGYWQSQFGNTGWPACGELDIMEHWGSNQNHVSSAIHTPSSFGGTVNTAGTTNSTVSTEFHTYTMVWSPQRVTFSIDDLIYYTYEPNPKDMDNWPFIADQYILLNVAMQPPIVSNFVESALILDYVRVYQQDPTSATDLSDSKINPINVYPNPVRDNLQILVEESLIGSTASIYTNLGQMVGSFGIDTTAQTIDMSGYSSGIYFINVVVGPQVFSRKVIVQR